MDALASTLHLIKEVVLVLAWSLMLRQAGSEGECSLMFVKDNHTFVCLNLNEGFFYHKPDSLQ